MIYPYSQHDIPPVPISYNGHQGGLQHTIVDILPSKSFEIRENPVIFTSNHQNYLPQYASGPSGYINYQQEPQHAQIVQPVIVLKIPGPQKYAAHLQTLLQQYIEIRAAQILKEIEELEIQQNQGHYQQNSYVQNDGGHHHQDYFPSIDQVYHLKQKRPHHHQQPIQEQIEPHHHQQPQFVYGPPIVKITSPSSAASVSGTGYESGYHQAQNYHYETQTEMNNYHHTSSDYQYNLPVPVFVSQSTSDHHSNVQNMQPPPVYGVPAPTGAEYEHEHGHHHDHEHHYDHEHHHDHEHNHDHDHHHDHEHTDPELKTLENSPRESHTRIRFSDTIKNDDHSTSYPLPSITPPTRNLYITSKHNSYQPHIQEQYDNNNNYQQLESEYQTEQSIVEITQRPFNYHAHHAKLLAKGQKRDIPITNDNSQIQKFHKVILRVKKNSAEKSLGSTTTS